MGLIEIKSFVNRENKQPIPVSELSLSENGYPKTKLMFASAFDSVTVCLTNKRVSSDIALTREQLIAIKDYLTKHLEKWTD